MEQAALYNAANFSVSRQVRHHGDAHERDDQHHPAEYVPLPFGPPPGWVGTQDVPLNDARGRRQHLLRLVLRGPRSNGRPSGGRARPTACSALTGRRWRLSLASITTGRATPSPSGSGRPAAASRPDHDSHRRASSWAALPSGITRTTAGIGEMPACSMTWASRRGSPVCTEAGNSATGYARTAALGENWPIGLNRLHAGKHSAGAEPEVPNCSDGHGPRVRCSRHVRRSEPSPRWVRTC